MNNVTKGPGDFWRDEPGYNDEDEGFEEWMEEMRDGDRLAYLERWLLTKRTATGRVLYVPEAGYLDCCTVVYAHDEAFDTWMLDVYRSEVMTQWSNGPPF